MQKSTNITAKFFNHYTGYTWSNEWYVMYHDLFGRITKGKGEINHLLSVGGGDHVLFALAHLGAVERLTHVDISSYSMVGAMAKFAVILEGTFKDWYAFSFNNCTESFVDRCLENRGFKPLVDRLKKGLGEGKKGMRDRGDRLPEDMFYGLAHSDGEPLQTNRMAFFLHEHIYDTLKKRLAKIKRYDLFIHDIWTLTLTEQPDLALLSNAYHNDNQPHPGDDFLVRKGGYIIYTECDGGRWFANNPTWKLVGGSKRSGSWDGKLYRRTA